MRKTAISIACAAMLAAPAAADEAWQTDYGEIIWETNYDGGAIFMIDLGAGKVGRFYIEGFGVDEPRGMFRGYWISTQEENMCSSQLTGPDGTASQTWGRLTLTFMSPDFPSDWAMLTGDCFAEPDEPLIAHAITG